MASFGIQIHGEGRSEFLDIRSNTVITLELNNPAYLGEDIDVIQGDYAFPFSVPLTDRNLRILRHPQRIDNYHQHIEALECTLWSGGKPLFSGSLRITSATRTEAKVSIIFTPLRGLKDVKLNQLAWPEYDMGATLSAQLALAKDSALNPENYPFVFFPVWNWGHDGRSEHDFEQAEFPNYYNIYTGQFESDDSIPAMPFLKLDQALQLGANYADFRFANGFQTNTELRRLVMFNNHDMNLPDAAGNINRPRYVKLAQHANETTFGEYLKGLCRLFCLAPFTNIFERTLELRPLKQLLGDAPKWDWSNRISHEYELNTELNLPSILGYDDVYESRALDKYFDREDLTYERTSMNTVLAGAPLGVYLEHITDELWNVFEEDSTLRKLRLAWGSLPPITVDGRNKNEFRSSLKTFLSTIVGVDLGPSNSWSARMPVMSMPGSNWERKNPYSDRLLFYRGMGPTSRTQLVPYASNSVFDGERQRVQIAGQDAQYSLSWRGPNGLYEQWWKEWYQALAKRKELSARVLLSEGELRSFNFRDRVRIGNRNAFVRRLQVTLTPSGPTATNAIFVIM